MRNGYIEVTEKVPKVAEYDVIAAGGEIGRAHV